MARYCVINELRSIDFHDALLQDACIQDNALYMIFSDAIIQGHSRPEIKDHTPCSVNDGEDRYACPQLAVTFKSFRILAVLRGGYCAQDAEGNTIAEHPPYHLTPNEYDGFLQLLLAAKNHLIHGMPYDAANGVYTLCIFLNADENYYEMEFSAETAIAEFEEFGKEAWYLEHYRKTHPQS